MEVRYTIEPIKGFGFKRQIKELLEFKELIYFITWRNIKVKYKEVVMGALWTALKPFIFMLILVLVAKRGMNLPSDGIPSPLFLMIGLQLWFLFVGIISACSSVTINGANLYQKVYFPKMILPITTVLTEFFDFLLGSIILVLMVGFYYYKIDFSLLEWILTYFMSIAITLFASFGVGLIVSGLNVKYRDVSHIIPFIIRIMFFITPIMYPLSIFSKYGVSSNLLYINPMTGPLYLARSAFNSAPFDWNILVISLSTSIVFFIIGIFVFLKHEKSFADIV